MKLTPQQRKTHHKLSKWKFKSELSDGETFIVNQLRDRVGESNVFINLQDIAAEYCKAICILLEIDIDLSLQQHNSKTLEMSRQEIVNSFERLQERGFICPVRSKDKFEYVVNVIPIWEKK